MSKKYLSCIALFAMGVLASVSTAQAIPMDGDLSFGGIMQAIDQNSDITTDWLSSTGVVIGNDITTSATGSFAAAGIGFATDFFTWVSNFQFGDSGIGLFDVRGYSFTVDNMDEVARSSSYMSFSGNGTISGNGFDATPYDWSFSADRTGGTYGAFSSTVTASAAPVPEPATMLLFGTGLAGLIGGVRKKKAVGKAVEA